MKKLIIYYNFIIVTTFVLLALSNANTWPELFAGAMFSPLLIYFILLVLPRKNRTALIKKKTIAVQKAVDNELSSIKIPKSFDMNRRLFLKLIASSGISLFLFAIFTKRAERAFFGSVPDSDSFALRSTSGAKIDPAEKLPTDGYHITEIDDSNPSTYYGYINKDGAWFISKETMSGSFRYTKGPSNFITNWTNRASLNYDYFDNVF